MTSSLGFLEKLELRCVPASWLASIPLPGAGVQLEPIPSEPLSAVFSLPDVDDLVVLPFQPLTGGTLPPLMRERVGLLSEPDEISEGEGSLEDVEVGDEAINGGALGGSLWLGGSVSFGSIQTRADSLPTYSGTTVLGGSISAVIYDFGGITRSGAGTLVIGTAGSIAPPVSLTDGSQLSLASLHGGTTSISGGTIILSGSSLVATVNFSTDTTVRLLSDSPPRIVGSSNLTVSEPLITPYHPAYPGQIRISREPVPAVDEPPSPEVVVEEVVPVEPVTTSETSSGDAGMAPNPL